MKFFYNLKFFIYYKIIEFNNVLYFFLLNTLCFLIFFFLKNSIKIDKIFNYQFYYYFMLIFHIIWITFFLLSLLILFYFIFWKYIFFYKKIYIFSKIELFEVYGYSKLVINNLIMVFLSGLWWAWFTWGWTLFYDAKFYLILILIIFSNSLVELIFHLWKTINMNILALLFLNLITIYLSLSYSSTWFNNLHQLETSSLENISFNNNIFYLFISIFIFICFFFVFMIKFYYKKNLINFFYNKIYEQNI